MIAQQKTGRPQTSRDPASGLTERQAELVRFLYRHLMRHGRPPTQAGMMAALGIGAPTGILCHLAALKRKGWAALSSAKGASVALAGVTMSQSAECARHFPAIDYTVPEGERLALLLASPVGKSGKGG